MTVADAEMRQSIPAEPVFTFDPELARSSLESPRIPSVEPVPPRSDADQLHRLLYRARAAGLIKADREDRWLYVSPHLLSEPAPVLVVDLGVLQPMLFCCRLDVDHADGEDPVSFSMRLLEQAVEKANAFAAMHRVARSAGRT